MYTVLDENLQVKGRLSLNNGQGNTTFFSDTITTQMATDNANDPAGLTTVDYTNQDKQGNAKQWSHTLTISVEATDLGTSINTTDYLMYFDSVADHYYLMKVINTSTDRNSGFITVSAINAAIFELGKQLIQAEQTLAQVDLKTFVSKMYKNVPFSLRVADDNLTVIDYVVSANTSLQALLQDLQTKYDVDVDSWVELDETGRIVDRVLYFGHLGSDNGELIRYGGAKGFENMTATEVSDIIYTKLYVTGKTDDKDVTKGHIGTVNNGLEYITDDDANQLMYAIGASQQQPVYLEGTITNSLLSEPKALLEWAKQQIGIFNRPRFNYTVSPLHDQIVALGDTVTVQDFHIKPEILVTSKVIQKTVSFASPETNTFVLGEFSSIFTDNMNKSANVINLIKKDVTVVQEAADIAKAQADAAYQQAVLAQENAIHAQTSADGKTTSYTVDSVQDLPQSANEGDIGWVKLSDGAHMYSYTDGKWVEKINPSMGSDIDKKVSDAVTQSKDYSDKAIADNQVKVDASIKSVDDKANQLKQDQSGLDTKAQGYANQAKADAITSANQAIKASSDSAAANLAQAKTDITNAYQVADGTINKKIDDTASSITSTISQNKKDADGKISTAQTTAQQAVDGLKTKVSQSDYDKKTGDLSTKVSTAQQTADQANTTIGNYQKSNDGRVTSAESAIKQNSTNIASKVSQSDYNAKTGQIDSQISTINQNAQAITQTVSKVSDRVDNLQVGGRNLIYKTAYLAYSYGPNNATVTVEPYDTNTNMYHIVSDKTRAGIYFYQQDGNNIKNGEKWSFGIDAKGTGIPATIGVETHAGDITQKGSISSDWSRVSFTGTSSYDKSAIVIYFNPDNGIVDVYVKLPKLEQGNTPTAWTPAPEDTDSKFSQQQQTIDSINSTVQQQGTNINNVSIRVQTAEGNISTAQNNITGLQSSQKQTADGLSQEVSDRKSGDSTVLQQGKDFTTSQVSNSENNMKSLINQKADSATVGVIQNDVTTLKANTQWQRIERFDDMNFMTHSGRFFIGASNNTNSAVTASLYMMVDAPQTDRITQTQWKDLDGSLMYRRTYDGSSWTPWTQMVMSSTLLNIFHDSWSLGTSTNDGITKQMITGIMGQPDGTLILKGNSLILDGNTTVTGDFYAKGGNFDNLNASHIKFGTLDGYQVNIANVNVNNLVGDTITGFNFNVNKQMTIASGGIIQSDVIHMDKDKFAISAPNISSYRLSSDKYKVSVSNGIFNVDSVLGSVSSDGNISVAVDSNSQPYKRGIFHSEYNSNNLMMSATNYTNGDKDEQLNISASKLDYMYSKTGFMQDATDHTSITANSIETTGTLNAFGVTQTPRVYSWPNLTLESIQQSVVLKAGNQNILQARENGYLYLLSRHSGSGGVSVQMANDGAFFMQSSATKYKEDIQYDGSTSVGDKFLTLDPVTWQDKDEYKQRKLYRETGIEPTHKIHMTDKRYYGLIAEDLVKAGLEEFVVRDEVTGEVNGLEYDKVAISLIPVVREQRNAINELRLEIERLKESIK
ncbi:hypothetical protein [Leuconostoc citreum]|uniref:hypothetical protein n=1 Tax=Leuconostoc citreum TaxID=33964 RepID=UPI00105FA80A|nr:hypothetical protein [Leuconostoc citreum]TDM36234.1 hypothetical protein CMW49_04015 [Leuconostoc citreum]TPF03021.1 hypothetical protein DIS11_04015 [Leuconostoc citreum]